MRNSAIPKPNPAAAYEPNATLTLPVEFPPLVVLGFSGSPTPSMLIALLTELAEEFISENIRPAVVDVAILYEGFVTRFTVEPILFAPDHPQASWLLKNPELYSALDPPAAVSVGEILVPAALIPFGNMKTQNMASGCAV